MARLFALFDAVKSRCISAVMNGRLGGLSTFLRIPAVGYVVFSFNMLVRRVMSLFGLIEHRLVEYPWALEQLRKMPAGSVVLDVGCAESLLSHVLVVLGFRSVGLDLRDWPFQSRCTTFVKRNIVDTGFPDGFFDGILVVSTIEHIGLEGYGQTLLGADLDCEAIRELTRILNPNGMLLVTTPFVGNWPNRLSGDFPYSRLYGLCGLDELTKGLKVVREDFFFPIDRKWVRLARREVIASFTRAGVARLVLTK